MIITKKIGVYPTHEQEMVLIALSEKCRLIYNFALAERVEDWERNMTKPKEERRYIGYVKQQNDLPVIKEKYPEYKWVYSKVLQGTLRKLDDNYKSFFALRKNGDTDARPPRFCGKQHFMALCYNQSGFKIDWRERVINFSHKHPSGVKLSFDLPWLPDDIIENTAVKQVEVVRDDKGRYFVCMQIEVDEPTRVDNGLYQAIDLGITNIVTAVNIHGEFVQIKNKRADLYWKGKNEEVQSKRDHCKKHSNKWCFYNGKLKAQKRKLANQMCDFQHVVSKKVVENTRANTIIIGDLDVKSMARKKESVGDHRKDKANKTLNHSLQNTGSMGRFARFLTYKAEIAGKRVIEIDESFTTKTCCNCGRVKNIRLSERTIHCDCGTVIDRDKNSAANIMLRFLSQEPLVDGESSKQHFLDGLHRHTAPVVVEAPVDSMEATPFRTW
jgi:putative transposase